MKRNLLISLVLVGLIVVSRLVPHIWNVAPVAAAALLAGAILPRKWALVVPLLGMLVSDFIIGFYHLPVILTVYACFALMALGGRFIKLNNPLYWLSGSLASSTLFFLATNFAVWATADWYPKTLEGLTLSYTLAIPFFRNTMLGDLFFTGALFGMWGLVRLIARNFQSSLVVSQT
ncbi:MAG: hypothetical protein HY973_02870 [Candidatus Kerfeldbacteria bacterium]|nr:hypothetical protein [Candidatus Kerfeldbacteria bacterium]